MIFNVKPTRVLATQEAAEQLASGRQAEDHEHTYQTAEIESGWIVVVLDRDGNCVEAL